MTYGRWAAAGVSSLVGVAAIGSALILCSPRNARGAAESVGPPVAGKPSPPAGRVEAAIKRCKEQIEWYDRHKATDRHLFFLTQISALVLAGLAPVVIAIEKAPKWLQASLPAVAAIALGLSTAFGFRDSWVRFGMAEEFLKSELVKFETRTTAAYGLDVSDETALRNFVERVNWLRVLHILLTSCSI
jgi:hypothetical protein